MSRVGDCWDNAVVESFFATRTKELLGDRGFATRAEASGAVFEFIEIWYNRQRRQPTLGYLTPVKSKRGYSRSRLTRCLQNRGKSTRCRPAADTVVFGTRLCAV